MNANGGTAGTSPKDRSPAPDDGIPLRPPPASARAYGRWMTRCQYHQIPASTRAAPPESVVSAARSIENLLESLDLGDCYRRWSLEARWDELVGRPLSTHSRPGTLQDGNLTLLVSSPTWRYEIQRHLTGPLLRKLQTSCPELKIRELTVRIDPGLSSSDRPPPRPGSPTP